MVINQYFSEGAPQKSSSEKFLGPKQSPPISHNDLKKDGAQLLLSKYTIQKLILCYETCLANQQDMDVYIYLYNEVFLLTLRYSNILPTMG